MFFFVKKVKGFFICYDSFFVIIGKFMLKYVDIIVKDFELI